MHKLKICLRALSVTLVISIILMEFCGCMQKYTDEEKFHEEKRKITLGVESSLTLDKVKDTCKRALYKELSVKNMFVYAYIVDGISTIELHVLTDGEQYVIYHIITQYSDNIVYDILNKIETKETIDYLERCSPTIVDEKIYFD